MRSTAFQLTLVTCIVFGSTTRALFAWPAEVYRNMVYDALELLPPSLGRVLALRSEAIIDGAHSLEGETASRLARDGLRGELSTDLILDVEARIELVVSMVDGHRP